MEPVYQEFLDHLEELSQLLEHMRETVRTKTVAARAGDLVELDQCMKQEQAFSMALRGMDQKREKMLEVMGIPGEPLSRLAEHYPEALQAQASRAAERALDRYEEYVSAANAALTAMECVLHDIGRMMPEEALTQAQPGEAAPPPRMRTDFRA